MSPIAPRLGLSAVLSLIWIAASASSDHRNHLEKLQIEQSQRLTRACQTKIEVSYRDLLQYPDLTEMDDDVQLYELCSFGVRVIESACELNREVNGRALSSRSQVSCRRASMGLPKVDILNRDIQIFADPNRASYRRGWETEIEEGLKKQLALTDVKAEPTPSAIEMNRAKADQAQKVKTVQTAERIQAVQTWYNKELAQIQASSAPPAQKGQEMSRLAEEFRRRLEEAVKGP